MSIESDLAIQKKEEIDHWRSKAKKTIDDFENVKPILMKRRGSFNLEEWLLISKLL